MEHKHIVVASIILGLIIIGMFVFAYIKRTEIETQRPLDTVPHVSDEVSAYAGITRIDAKHYYREPTHTITGEINMPTPCDLLDWSTRIMESSPEQVIIDFNVINHTDTCAQVVTPQRFLATFDAHQEAGIRATFEGRSIELNLVPALDGESPDDFELFIKG